MGVELLAWKLDGEPIPGVSGTSLDLLAVDLRFGDQQVSATATDMTPWVRDEVARQTRLRQTLTWQVRRIPGDMDNDHDVDQFDFTIFHACFTGASVFYDPNNLPPGCTLIPNVHGIIAADFDRDGDVDQSDFGIFQRCYSGETITGNPACAA